VSLGFLHRFCHQTASFDPIIGPQDHFFVFIHGVMKIEIDYTIENQSEEVQKESFPKHYSHMRSDFQRIVAFRSCDRPSLV